MAEGNTAFIDKCLFFSAIDVEEDKIALPGLRSAVALPFGVRHLSGLRQEANQIRKSARVVNRLRRLARSTRLHVGEWLEIINVSPAVADAERRLFRVRGCRGTVKAFERVL